MSCEKQGGQCNRLSLVDGSVKQAHFRLAEEILASINQLSKIEPKPVSVGIKRPFVPFLTDVNITGL